MAVFLRLRARCLYDVFAPPLQAGVFEHAFQNHLTPVALGFVAAAGEGVGEGVGVVVQAVVELLQAFEFVFEGQAFFRFFFVGVLNQLGEAADAFVQRVEQAAEVFAVLFGKAAAFFFEYFVGQVAELAAHEVAGVVEQGEFFFLRLPFLFEQGVEAFVADLLFGQLLLQFGIVGFQTA